jgi:hypothetical protein
MMQNKVANKICVLWFRLNFTKGVLTIKHSMYFGSFNIFCRSPFMPDGKSSLTICKEVWPALLIGDRRAPLISKALTGLVVFSSATLLIARCKGVNP